jgi:hypothetical protein
MEGHTDHYAQAKGNSLKAIKSVKKFVVQVKDVEVREEMQYQLAKLERLVSML